MMTMSPSSRRLVSRVSRSFIGSLRVPRISCVVLLGLLLRAPALAQALPGGPMTLSELRALSASDGTANAYFGYAVSVSGNLAAVGAYGADSGRGAVYLFAQNQGGADQWQQVRKIMAPDGQPGRVRHRAGHPRLLGTGGGAPRGWRGRPVRTGLSVRAQPERG